MIKWFLNFFVLQIRLFLQELLFPLDLLLCWVYILSLYLGLVYALLFWLQSAEVFQFSYILFELDYFLICLPDLMRWVGILVSMNTWHLIPSTSTTRTGYVTEIWFVVRSIFMVFRHKEVQCFPWQCWHIFVPLNSKALCFDPVQLKQIFFLDNFSPQSDTLLTVLHSIDLCPSLSQ